jgi:hypothetical protein
MTSTTRPRRTLAPATTSEGRSVLAPDSKAALRGHDPHGFDYVCGHCRDTVLVENTVEGEIWDLAFRCFKCKGISDAPSLPKGRPIGPCAFAPYGVYRLSETVDIPLGGCLVGSDAVDQRSGERGSGLFVEEERAPVVMDEVELRRLVRRTKALLGDKYSILVESHRRGLLAKTPPSTQHRLMQLLGAVQAGITSFVAGQPAFDANAIGELHLALTVLEKWQGNPAWPSILRTLENATDFRHAVISLAAASFLIDSGNDVGIQEESTTRSADLQIATRSNVTVGLEVKSPSALQGPREPIRADEADRIIDKAIRDAGTGSRGQLSPNRPGLLIVGGFHLQERDLDALEEASKRLLLRTGNWRKHIAGISVLSLGIYVDHVNPRIEQALSIRISLNPQYTGQTAIDQSERPWLSKLPLRYRA